MITNHIGLDFLQWNLESQPWLRILVVVALGLVFFFLVARSAQRIGADAAIQRLRKWTRLPNSVLRLVSAPNYRTALQGVANTLAEAVNALGVLVVLSDSDGGGNGVARQLLLTNGTLQGSSDVNMLAAVENADVFSGNLGGNSYSSSLIDIDTKETPAQFRQVFTHLSNKGRLIGFGLRLHSRHQAEGSSQCLMLFDLGHQKSLDRFEVEAIQATIEQFPRVAESLTGRFAQAELSEKLLEESRRRDEILQQMLNGFQHDVANALRNIELSVDIAHATMMDDDTTPAESSLETAYTDVKDAVALAGQVAYSASMLPEIARGDTPIVEARAYDSALLFSRLLQPLISVKANGRKELVVNYEVAQGLPQIMVDEVPFFRAMSNVIGNAFKFTERGGINILVYRDEDQVAFAVSDTGLGIPADELEQVGTPRFRTSNAADISGSGIGLWTTKRLVKAMGGTVTIESKLGRGSTVILRFQIASNGDG
jgi:signal transduction histidine kinase